MVNLSVIGLRGFPGIEGGVERHCESLYPKLKGDINVTIYRRKPYVSTGGSYNNIHFVDFPSTKTKGLEPFFHSFLASVHAMLKKPDVVHYHNIGPALFSPIMKLRSIPVMLTYHSPNYEHKKWGRLGRKVLLLSEKIALRTADYIIFVNKFQMEKYDGDVRKKSVYIPNGINDMSVSLSTAYLEELGLMKKQGEFTDLCAGPHLMSTKDVGKAYKLTRHEGFKLVIVGGVEFENRYMKELEELSRDEDIVFTGYIFGDRLYQLYTYAALYVLASNNEGFPLVLLEAMKYGLDVIVSDIPATHLVGLNKDDYFKTGDFEELADKITKRIKNIRDREYDLSNYDWKKIADTTSDIIHEAAGK